MIEYDELAGRPHGGRPTVPILLSADARAAVAAAMRAAKAEQCVLRRAQALLMMADGVPSTDIARVLGVHVRTVQDWRRRRFDCGAPVDTLADAKRSGRPPSLSPTPMQPGSKLKPVGCRPT